MLPDFVVIQCRQFHEKIMGMLAVYNRFPESGFTLLKENWISLLSDCGGLEAKHRPKGECSLPFVMLCHAHQPVSGEKLVSTARACLLRLIEKGFAVQHELPLSLDSH